MRMTRFRIRDIGWITVGLLADFVEKNESGKVVHDQGIPRLNSPDEEHYDIALPRLLEAF